MNSVRPRQPDRFDREDVTGRCSGGQHQPILRRVPRPGNLPAHHDQLVRQQRDLDVLHVQRRNQTNKPSTRQTIMGAKVRTTMTSAGWSQSAVISGL
jgi:hypothetical protein